MPPKFMQQVNPNDPNAVLQFAIGPLDGVAQLVPQRPGALPEVHKMYSQRDHTFVVKKAQLGQKDDWRCYDAETGRMVYNSHHPGKDPYAKLDPLGLGNNSNAHATHSNPLGGEWESVCDVSGHKGGFKIRPSKMSIHGRQYCKINDSKLFSVSKQSKLKTMSLAKSFCVRVEGGPRDGEEVMFVTSDMYARTIQFLTGDGQLIAIAQKPLKTLILNATLGVGSELQLVVAPGVDCTFILAAFLCLQQVGEHIVKDAFGNFVFDPLQDQAVDEVTGMVPGGDQAMHMYQQANHNAVHGAKIINQIQQMMK
eukprot:TRINITY_DN4505_c0_g1_i1.p2 TRINITY_DN4505_c0_g1~~TRINITY_DN4505_c0_g1_i1.p2  ORF type:complete len:310 (+),score=119.91 TRINITY_DN4505_c0_g1_i1:103-1032(+)